LILKRFLLSLKRQFYIGGGESLKKPLNPFLGELFIADYTDGDATAHLVTEQVSHHPPITAFTITHCDSGRVIEKVDLVAGTPAVPAETLPVEEMDPCETRRAWRPVIEAIRKGDMADTSRQKAR
jgi:hypothetical protein